MTLASGRRPRVRALYVGLPGILNTDVIDSWDLDLEIQGTSS